MNYLIGIGGTGAKCVEAVAHMCAAGLGSAEKLYTFFVDPDESNGSLGRAQDTLRNYTDCRALKLGPSLNLFRTPISVADPDVWSPFPQGGNKQLGLFFGYSHMVGAAPAAARLMDVLYSGAEKSTELSEGFRGHPAIGAAVMGKTVNLAGVEPWQTFEAHLRQDAAGQGQPARVVLVGSVFGGTGAAGIPTIGRLIKQRVDEIGLQKVSLSAVMMLPYFSFEVVKENTLKADAQDFLLNTHAALKYYYAQEYLETFKSVYFLGEGRVSPMARSAKGGAAQKNEPHFLETYAALAALDFFEGGSAGPCVMVAREEAGCLKWSDLPGEQRVRCALGQMTRFAFSYKYVYYPKLMEIQSRAGGYAAPWYRTYFEKRKLHLDGAVRAELDTVLKFCDAFLLWLGYTHESARDMRVELIDYLAFCEKAGPGPNDGLRLAAGFAADRFGGLILPYSREERLRLGDLWERMCDSRVTDNMADGVGRFIHALYRECGHGLTDGKRTGGK
jgi:hypothetical protein